MKKICEFKISVPLLCFLLVASFVFTMLPVGNVSAAYRPGATNRNIINYQDDPIYYYQSPWKEDGTLDYFYYPIYNDPMRITDEDFYGVWDSEMNMWVDEPYFRYSEYPDIAPVEEAAKKGDYETAKYELLEYYKAVAPYRINTQSASSNTTAANRYVENFARNVYPCNFLSGNSLGYIMTDSNEWKRYTLSNYYITSALNTAAGSFDIFNMAIGSVDKYYTTAEIYSKDAGDEYAPVLKATINGIEKEFPVMKDAMIVAGTSSAVNYGYDEIMKVEEHGTWNNYDETTRRAYIAFDIRELTANDSIENVRMEITARNNAPKGDKELSVVWHREGAWTEDSVCWDTFAEFLYFSVNDMEAWDYVTPSAENLKGKTCEFFRQQDITRLLCQPYYFTRDERYAYTWIRQYMAIINSIGYSREEYSGLDGSCQLSSACTNVFYILESKYMTPDRFTAMMKHFCQIGEYQVDYFYGNADNNYGTYATASVYDLVACYPELIKRDEWIEATIIDNERLFNGFTLEDGTCIEQAPGYINTLLSTMKTPIITAKNTGAELPYSDKTYQVIYDCLQNMLHLMGPYHGSFNLSDGYDIYNDYTSSYKEWYNFGIFDDPHLEYRATNGQKGKLPENPTSRFPVGLRTIMRSGWGEQDIMLSFTNAMMPSLSHGHKDALSLTLFAYGRYLLTDQSYGSVQVGDNVNYMRSPVQHNLVTVNDINDYLTDGTVTSYSTLKSGSTGKEEAFESNAQYDFQEYSTDLYTTTQLSKRSITFVKNDKFFIVSDYHIPTDPAVENLFAQHWHMYPGSGISNDDNKILSSNFHDANVKVVPVEKDEIDDIQYVTTRYSERGGMLINSMKGMYLKTKSGAGRFTTIIVPEGAEEDIQVETTVPETGLDPDLVNSAYFRISNPKTQTVKYYYYYHLNDESKKQEATIGEYKTDATTLLISKNVNKKIESVFMMNGTYIKDDTMEHEYLVKFENPVESFAYTAIGNDMMFDSSTLTQEDINDMTVYADGAKRVYFAGNTVDVKNQGGYFYFGDQPIIDAEDDDKDSEDSDTDGGRTEGTVGGISGGGSSGGGGGGATTVKPPVKEEDKAEDVKPSEPETPVKPTTPSYEDVKESDWYFEYVEELSEKGIVSGDGTGNFNPTSNVTREQFLKMLIEATAIDTEEDENVFEDVISDAWYKPYVLKAKNLGIVNGVSDTEFGVGSNITRQDMAVMIVRTIEKLGTEMNVKNAEFFADNDMVSDYAKDAVIFMKSIGLVEGYNNEYRPLDNLTRAEASKVICKLLQMML